MDRFWETEVSEMKKNAKVVIGCSIVAAVCFGIVSYGHFYRGRMGLGWVFAVLTVAQLALAVVNDRISKKIDQSESVSEDTPADTDESSEDEPWKAALADELFEKYGVLPEYYEDLGDGIYQVYVEVGGEIVPFVAVNSATGDYHG